jgi:hypothetical protein
MRESEEKEGEPMSVEGRRGEVKPVSFKMPLHIYTVVQAAAVARGVDVSSVLNWIIAENLPKLIRLQEQRDAAMVIASTQGLADAVAERLKRIQVEENFDAASRELQALLERLKQGELEGGQQKRAA